MATYSTNLALTLLDTGEGAGTWGNTTNTNLGTLLEQAISGYTTQSLTTGTTLTLTIPNGTTGEARNMYLEFSGNGSVVTVPSNKKLYFIHNNCTSGTIDFRVAGQTGVSVAKGKRVSLVSNGTDVVQAINHISVFSSDSAVITRMYLNTSGDPSPSLTSNAYFTAPAGGQAIVGVASATSEVSSINWNKGTTGDNAFVAFATEGTYTPRGSISYNRGAGTVAYNTTSDRRAKTIYGPVTDSGQVIDALNVYEGKMNWGTEIYPMMIADEMQPIVPYSVTGQPNATNPDGSPKYQQVDYTALVPLLIAEIQSLRARVSALGG